MVAWYHCLGANPSAAAPSLQMTPERFNGQWSSTRDLIALDPLNRPILARLDGRPEKVNPVEPLGGQGNKLILVKFVFLAQA